MRDNPKLVCNMRFVFLLLNLLILTVEFGFAQARPNILLIITDDQGYADYGAYGGADDVQTPAMDKIANSGVRFTQAYATAPVCNASRSGIITGSYQERWGTYYYGGHIFPENRYTLPEILGKEGYRCVKIGKNHYTEILDNNVDVKDPLSKREFPLNHGYEEFVGFSAHRHDYFKLATEDDWVQDPQDDRMSQFGPLWRNDKKEDFHGYTTQIFADEAINQIEKEDDRPFFMELSFNAVHHPIYQAPDPYLKKYGLEKFPEWDPKKESFMDYHARTCWRGEEDPVGRQRYLANLDCLDDNLGRVLDALETTGKGNNTLVIFISDNGGSQNTYANNGILKGHKYILEEGGIRTPFTMSWPGHIAPGTVRDRPVSHMDILPTCLEAARSTALDSLQVDGKSLFPLIASPDLPLHDTLVWDIENEWVVRLGAWKLHIVKKDNHFRTIHIDKGTYLYNLDEDPSEAENLADNHPEKVAELTEIHRLWREEMGD